MFHHSTRLRSLDNQEASEWRKGRSRLTRDREKAVRGKGANWKQRFCTLHIQKKKGFILLSFTFCLFHTIVLGNDVVAHSITESFLSWSYSFTVALLMSHVVSFYWAILGAIYSVQSGIKHLCLLALTSAVLNFWVFIGRTWFELEIIKFREEIY